MLAAVAVAAFVAVAPSAWVVAELAIRGHCDSLEEVVGPARETVVSTPLQIPPYAVRRGYWVSRPMHWREMSTARSENWTSDGPCPATRLA